MPLTDETMKLIELSRSRMQQDLAYLRTLSGGLAQTQAVIERATLAYAVSNHLLGKNDQAAVEPPQPDQSERAKRSK
jgi:hypothetical protein